MLLFQIFLFFWPLLLLFHDKASLQAVVVFQVIWIAALWVGLPLMNRIR